MATALKALGQKVPMGGFVFRPLARSKAWELGVERVCWRKTKFSKQSVAIDFPDEIHFVLAMPALASWDSFS
jgi:hypothetical protein